MNSLDFIWLLETTLASTVWHHWNQQRDHCGDQWRDKLKRCIGSSVLFVTVGYTLLYVHIPGCTYLSSFQFNNQADQPLAYSILSTAGGFGSLSFYPQFGLIERGKTCVVTVHAGQTFKFTDLCHFTLTVSDRIDLLRCVIPKWFLMEKLCLDVNRDVKDVTKYFDNLNKDEHVPENLKPAFNVNTLKIYKAFFSWSNSCFVDSSRAMVGDVFKGKQVGFENIQKMTMSARLELEGRQRAWKQLPQPANGNNYVAGRIVKEKQTNFEWKWINGQCLVVSSGYRHLKRGDRVRLINWKTVKEGSDLRELINNKTETSVVVERHVSTLSFEPVEQQIQQLESLGQINGCKKAPIATSPAVESVNPLYDKKTRGRGKKENTLVKKADKPAAGGSSRAGKRLVKADGELAAVAVAQVDKKKEKPKEKPKDDAAEQGSQYFQ